ncbi:hypothetical protein RFI_05865 [Reticulomyxa filosa]|uniref:Uncharacterized protein n=1 Tax=Reticulomyxa filosa TaxID=46433 RepID=X6NY57_RETFI|nr:hypothetical protein RFI_05865 [Reticulomyxa filosa]|eukprot:ETO31255.1 hypothetical protein RFI_05865 [Reticulomyxa filosa]
MVRNVRFIPTDRKSCTLTITYNVNHKPRSEGQKGRARSFTQGATGLRPPAYKQICIMAYEPFHFEMVVGALEKLVALSRDPNEHLENIFELYIDFPKTILPKHLRPQKYKWEALQQGEGGGSDKPGGDGSDKPGGDGDSELNRSQPDDDKGSDFFVVNHDKNACTSSNVFSVHFNIIYFNKKKKNAAKNRLLTEKKLLSFRKNREHLKNPFVTLRVILKQYFLLLHLLEIKMSVNRKRDMFPRRSLNNQQQKLRSEEKDKKLLDLQQSFKNIENAVILRMWEYYNKQSDQITTILNFMTRNKLQKVSYIKETSL